MNGASPRVVKVELVRASATTSLLRVDVEHGPQNSNEVALLVADRTGRRRLLRSLPVPSDGSGQFRAAFGLDAGERPTELTIIVGDVELPISLPPERSREDAVQSVALRQARERLAELEQALAERATAAPGAPAGDDDAQRLAQQLAEHRLLRAQLTRELKSVRAQTAEMQGELQGALDERELLAQQLEQEREGSAAERERLAERLQRAHQRVEYLERRLVEIQGKSLHRHHRD